MKVFAKKYRGFDLIEIDLKKINFLVGDNSSGKSSILYLIHAVCKDDLNNPPKFNEGFGVGEYDYFSPYFNYEDVVFGYSSEEDGDNFCKIITVKKIKDGPPKITKCSYFVSGKVVSVKRAGERILYKVSDFKYENNGKCIEEHFSQKGYKYLKESSGISLGNPSFIIANLDFKELGLRDVIPKFYRYVLDETRLVSPIRALPEKFYRFRRKFNLHGLHFAAMWLDFSEAAKSGAFRDVEEFGVESGLFERVVVEKVSAKIDESPLLVFIEKSGKRFLLNQVGVGVSQVVPVLMESVYALGIQDTPVLIQQPELHLHPIAQAALGSYFYKAGRSGLRGVIETHSSYLMDRFRADLRDGAGKGAKSSSLAGQDVTILFCQNSSTGNFVHEIVVNDDGSMSGEPDQYHAFFVDELVRTMF